MVKKCDKHGTKSKRVQMSKKIEACVLPPLATVESCGCLFCHGLKKPQCLECEQPTWPNIIKISLRLLNSLTGRKNFHRNEIKEFIEKHRHLVGRNITPDWPYSSIGDTLVQKPAWFERVTRGVYTLRGAGLRNPWAKDTCPLRPSTDHLNHCSICKAFSDLKTEGKPIPKLVQACNKSLTDCEIISKFSTIPEVNEEDLSPLIDSFATSSKKHCVFSSPESSLPDSPPFRGKSPLVFSFEESPRDISSKLQEKFTTSFNMLNEMTTQIRFAEERILRHLEDINLLTKRLPNESPNKKRQLEDYYAPNIEQVKKYYRREGQVKCGTC